jgi:hypothetical protein
MLWVIRFFAAAGGCVYVAWYLLGIRRLFVAGWFLWLVAFALLLIVVIKKRRSRDAR